MSKIRIPKKAFFALGAGAVAGLVGILGVQRVLAPEEHLATKQGIENELHKNDNLTTTQSTLPKSLEELAIDEVVKMSGKSRDNLNAKFSSYGTETFPLGFGYRGGTYLTVKDAKKGDLFIFSQRGEYLGVAIPLDIKMDSRWGFGNAWKSTEYGSDIERVFVWTDSAASTVYEETKLDNGLVQRRWGGEGPNPVYKIVNNQFVKDKKPYIGTFGGDGQHYIDDRGNGLFFVVQEEVRDEKGRTIEEIGKLFNVISHDDNSENYVPVRRRLGSNKLAPNNEGENIDYWNERFLSVYQRIVPKSMQGQ